MNFIEIKRKNDSKKLVDYSKVVIPKNYVLILPDPNHEFFHDKEGNETDFMIGRSLMVDNSTDGDEPGELVDTVLSDSQHFSVRGKVYVVPKKLSFPKEEIKKLRKNFGNNNADMTRLGELTAECLDYETEIELSVGDEVIFDYLSHIACYEDGRWIETDLGDMFIIRYDEIHMKISSDGKKTPINGWMVITREEKPKASESGIELVHEKEDDISKKAFARVIHPGTPVKTYKQDFMKDDPYPFSEGQRIMYRPGGSRPLEWQLHQTLYPGDKALLIHRKDIFYAEEHV